MSVNEHDEGCDRQVTEPHISGLRLSLSLTRGVGVGALVVTFVATLGSVLFDVLDLVLFALITCFDDMVYVALLILPGACVPAERSSARKV